MAEAFDRPFSPAEWCDLCTRQPRKVLSGELRPGSVSRQRMPPCYASDELMAVKTLVTAVATLLTPEMHTSAIKATNSAYSTRS